MFILNTIILSLTICIDSFILCFLTRPANKKEFFIIPFFFALFQTLFLYIGYLFGSFLELYLTNYIKYIVFLTYSFMALKLIVDTFINKSKEVQPPLNSFKSIIVQAIFTSCDSLFLGMPLSFNNNNFIISLFIISSLTFTICFIALCIRKKCTTQIDDKINLIGAIILFFFAFKSLL